MILITGASGFIGSYLTKEMADHCLKEVVLSDIVPPQGMLAVLSRIYRDEGADYPFEYLDASSPIDLLHVIKRYAIHTIIHCASLRAPEAQMNPIKSLKVDVESLMNILEMAGPPWTYETTHVQKYLKWSPRPI